MLLLAIIFFSLGISRQNGYFQKAGTLGALLLSVDSIDGRKAVLERPSLQWGPKTPGQPFPHSPNRHKTCYVPSSSHSNKHKDVDSAPEIFKAFKNCNRGGRVVLDGTYTVASPLDLTFLEAVDVVLTGTITFSNDIDYWVENSFKYAFQNSSAFWRFGGKDVNIYGGGMVYSTETARPGMMPLRLTLLFCGPFCLF